MKKISLLVTLIFLMTNTLYAAKPCYQFGGLAKVAEYEECMKNPEEYKSVMAKLGERKKNFDEKNKTIWDMFKNRNK